MDAVQPATTDEFKLGDSVWVSGVKKGSIVFIGETQFAPGVWAGIVLDEPIGKNDGTVSGVRYFACQPLHGIFARLHTLTSRAIDASSGPDKQPVSKPSDTGSDGVGSSTSGSVHDGQADRKERVQVNNEDTLPAALSTSRPSKLQPTSSRPSGLARFSRSTGTASSSSSSLSQTAATASQSQQPVEAATAASSKPRNTAGSLHALKVGDRVVIGGNKTGTLRYFGATHFAKGEWAGIELDEPIGKNDGSVEGKR